MITRQELMEQLIPLVIEEVGKLKLYATQSEIANLDRDTVSGNNRTLCIYGQLTGHCNSERSVELISQCCERVYIKDPSTREFDLLNGHPSTVEITTAFRDMSYVSPIEQIIFTRTGGRTAAQKIIDFLQNRTEILDFQDIL